VGLGGAVTQLCAVARGVLHAARDHRAIGQAGPKVVDVAVGGEQVEPDSKRSMITVTGLA
jgi:hypothetical protein